MTEEEYAHILKQLTGKTQYIYYHLMGEPLLHPLLPRFLALAKAAGFHSVITTNGTLLKKRGDEILAAGLHKVSISLHSFEEGSDIDHTAYLGQVCEFAEKAAENGTIVSLRLWNKGFDDGRNDTTERLLRQFLPGDWTENSRGLRIRDKIFLEWGDRFHWPDENAPENGGNVFCYGLKDQFGILCDGTVVPCCLDSEGVINLGNIFEESLTEILASPRAIAIKEGFARRCAVENLCRRCGYAQRF
jgi:MoaA/NifB/PqqE/SkfB family radical SAM enzyme